MSTLKVYLLGPPRIERDGAECKLERRKALGLLAYLAVTGQPHSRDALAELFFPRLEKGRSRNSLRQTLSSLRAAIGEDRLQTDRGMISLAGGPGLWVDLHEFRTLAVAGRRGGTPVTDKRSETGLRRAADLCRGEFLAGFYLRDSPEFDDWQTTEQETFRDQCASIFDRLASRCVEHKDVAGATQYARQRLALDPLEESTHRRLMDLYRMAGRTTAALKQYRICRSILRRELGTSPDRETEALRERIEAGKEAPAAAKAGGRAAVKVAPSRRTTLESRFRAFTATLPSSLCRQLTVTAEGETRHVTVLLVELCGPRTPTALASFLKAAVDIFARYEGRVDSVWKNELLAVFGVPGCHEDDTERAVLAALELRDRTRDARMDARMAVATGPMRIGPAEPANRGEASGGRSLAEAAGRLKNGSKPGEIIVDEATHRRVLRSFETTPLPTTPGGDGRDETVRRVEGRSRQIGKVRGIDGLEAELIGRAEECRLLEQVYARVRAGAGQVVSIVGAAGVGKSRLVSELKIRIGSLGAPAESPRWLEGRCLELAVTVAYWPFVEILGRHFAFAPRQADATRAQLVTAELERLHAAGRFSYERLEETAPILGRLLSIRFGNEWDTKLAHAPPEQIRHQTLLAIRDCLLALAGERPLVLVIEDLHWADTLTLDAVSLLMESLTLAPLMLVCVSRPEPDHGRRRLADIAAHECPGRTTEVPLRELTAEESRRLMSSLLSSDAISLPVRDAILEPSQGNPFFIEEVIRSLIEAGVLGREGDRWTAAARVPATTVLETVQRVILGRVDRLETRLRQVIESASVIGRIFQREILERAVEVQHETDAALAELEKRALIRVDREGNREECSFKHVLTQQAVYGNLLERRREGLHGRIAEAMEGVYRQSLGEYCEQIAYHYARSGNREKAIEYLLAAGERAAESHLNRAALEHLERALDLVNASEAAPDNRRIHLLVTAGKVYEVIGEHKMAEARFREAAELGRRLGVPADTLVRILFWLCKAITACHRPCDYIPIAREALALTGGDVPSPEALMMEFVIAYGSVDEGGDFSALRAYAVRRGELVRNLPYAPDTTINTTYLAWAHLMAKDEAEAVRWLEWAETAARSHDDLVSLAAVHVRRGRDLLASRGDFDGAVAALREACGLYRRTGARYLETHCHLSLGDVQYRFGRLEEADASRARAAEVYADLPHHAHLAAEQELLSGQIALARGAAAEAAARFRSALAASPGRPWGYFLRFLIGRALIAQGKRGEAAACLRELLHEAHGFRVPPAYALRVDAAHLLSLLEDCYDDPNDFRKACQAWAAARGEARPGHLQWCLEPAHHGGDGERIVHESFSASLDGSWTWHDPYRDGRYRLEDGLFVSAAVGRGLEGANLGAPRLLRTASGDLSVQAECGPADPDAPAAGGLIIWKDPHDYLRLDVGSLSPGHVAFGGCIGNGDLILGRGRLSSAAVVLRLERRGRDVRALACIGGGRWHEVGRVGFAVEDPIAAGVFVDGAVRPEVYPASIGKRPGVRFADFRMSRINPAPRTPKHD